MMSAKIISIILHNVRSAENVGAIFRTADAAGVSKVYLTGYTPTPQDRFKRSSTKVSKTALGAEKSVAWKAVTDSAQLIQELHRAGWRVVAVEQDTASIPYTELKLENKTAFVFGNEVDGIPKEILKTCDAVVEIPMHGAKESLNVSVAVGVVLFHARYQVQ